MGNKGRPPGSRNKLTKEGLRAAREAFAPISEKALILMEGHLDTHFEDIWKLRKVVHKAAGHRRAIDKCEDIGCVVLAKAALFFGVGDCATCRHIFSLSSEYTYGKPTQRHEFSIDDFIHRLREEHPAMTEEQGNVIARRAQEFWQGTR